MKVTDDMFQDNVTDVVKDLVYCRGIFCDMVCPHCGSDDIMAQVPVYTSKSFSLIDDGWYDTGDIHPESQDWAEVEFQCYEEDCEAEFTLQEFIAFAKRKAEDDGPDTDEPTEQEIADYNNLVDVVNAINSDDTDN